MTTPICKAFADAALDRHTAYCERLLLEGRLITKFGPAGTLEDGGRGQATYEIDLEVKRG